MVVDIGMDVAAVGLAMDNLCDSHVLAGPVGIAGARDLHLS